MTTLVLKLVKHGARSASVRRRNGSAKVAGWIRAIQLLELWMTRATTRRELSELDTRMLRDIGITRAQARCEATKPFWQP